MAMMISWVAPVHPSHPYLENDPAPSFAPTICAFHLGFSLVLPVLADYSCRFTSRYWLRCPQPAENNHCARHFVVPAERRENPQLHTTL